VKYYYPEHIQGYAKAKAEGKTTWGQLFGEKGFDDFSAREFLHAVLPALRFTSQRPTVFNYGCGTGPDAFFLAERGLLVDAADLIPEAIEMAKEQASVRGLDINYQVMDICDLSSRGKKYDMIVDSYCLQCIVFDEERKRLFSAVRSRLNPRGYYLISTAVMDAAHRALVRPEETVTDANNGTEYVRYGERGNSLIDLKSGLVLIPCDDPGIRGGITGGVSSLPDAVLINGKWFLPHRRHLTHDQLEAELRSAGFRVIYRFPEHEGELACVKSSAISE
jgi:2-polyprenyl-3-methyl-5-hydroxy-6-metoxy-1,4-benzoquinol methylase